MSTDARSLILSRVRSALGAEAAAKPALLRQQWESLPRDYDRVPHLSPEGRLDLLEDRLRDYDAEVTRVPEDAVAAAIAAILASRGTVATLVPRGFPAAWLPPGIAFTEDAEFTPRELDGFDGVLTAATLAIAETGTLVLQNVPGQGRRAGTLVPDFHLCVLRAEDISENVPEAFVRLEQTAMLPTTFISGPSATADIEMTRIKGVHGPRFLHVLIIAQTP